MRLRKKSETMGRRFKIAVAVAAAVVAVAATGCFKSVVAYTRYTMAIYNQTEESGAYSRARDIESYAFYVDTTEWRVASYEDALNRTITNKTTGEQLSVPDVLGEFNSSKEYSMSMVLQQEISMIVVVNPELKLYAYRSYELPVNLESVLTKLYMCSWRRTYTSSGWVVVNQFYVEPPEETPETPDEGTGTDESTGSDDGAGTDYGTGTDDGTGTDTDQGTGSDGGTDENNGGAAARMAGEI